MNPLTKRTIEHSITHMHRIQGIFKQSHKESHNELRKTALLMLEKLRAELPIAEDKEKQLSMAKRELEIYDGFIKGYKGLFPNASDELLFKVETCKAACEKYIWDMEHPHGPVASVDTGADIAKVNLIAENCAKFDADIQAEKVKEIYALIETLRSCAASEIQGVRNHALKLIADNKEMIDSLYSEVKKLHIEFTEHKEKVAAAFSDVWHAYNKLSDRNLL